MKTHLLMLLRDNAFNSLSLKRMWVKIILILNVIQLIKKEYKINSGQTNKVCQTTLLISSFFWNK
jgi:hypothetical protein